MPPALVRATCSESNYRNKTKFLAIEGIFPTGRASVSDPAPEICLFISFVWNAILITTTVFSKIFRNFCLLLMRDFFGLRANPSMDLFFAFKVK